MAVVAVLAMPALASAAVTITAGSANIVQGQSAVVDIVITSDAGEGLNSMDLDILLSGLGGPVATVLDMNGAGTLFSQFASTVFPGIDPPSDTELFQSVANNAAVNSVIGASSILARVTFDTSATAVGSYGWFIDDDTASGGGSFGTILQATGGQVFPQFIPGIINVVPVPEPSSIVLGLFAAAGLASVVIRRRRSA
ncbi:MAG: PEP-CTERM sorting domain-containing protein [Pirellulales bacterium]